VECGKGDHVISHEEFPDLIDERVVAELHILRLRSARFKGLRASPGE